MKNVLLFVLFITLHNISYEQSIIDNTGPVQLIANWSVGDKKSLKIGSATAYVRTNRLSGKDSSQFYVTVDVLESDTSGYLLQWKYTECDCQKNDISIENQFFSNFINVPILYKVSKTGQFLKLVNDIALAAFNSKLVDSLIEVNSNNPAYRLSYTAIKDMTGSKEGIELIILKHIVLYHKNFGVPYLLNKIREEYVEMPNLFGGQPYRNVEKSMITKLNVMDSLFQIVSEVEVNTDLLKNDVIRYAKTIAKKQNGSATFNFEKEIVAYTDKSSQIVDMKKGIVVKSLLTRTIKLGIANRIITLNIDLISNNLK